jgi:hypothetical protein
MRPSSLFANTLELRFHVSRFEPLETLYFLASLGLLCFFALSPPLARCMPALCMLCRSAHALYRTWERWDMCCVRFFEPEVVRAFEALGDLVKFLVIVEESAVHVSSNIGSGRRH